MTIRLKPVIRVLMNQRAEAHSRSVSSYLEWLVRKEAEQAEREKRRDENA